jgi:hypothetical protein
MINNLFRVLLTFNATSLLVIIFSVQKEYTIGKFLPKLCFIEGGVPDFISYLIYLMIPVLLTGLSILLSSKLGNDSFEKGNVVSVEHANNSFLPSYLGYFFVALSVGNVQTLCFVYGLLFVFTFLSQALYFNPLFLIFGFEFYNITTKNGVAIFLISRKQYRMPDDIEISKAYRINNYTLIERD